MWGEYKIGITEIVWEYVDWFDVALFDFNAYCYTMFALSDENGVHIMKQCYPVRMLQFNLWTVVGLANTVMSYQLPLTVDGFLLLQHVWPSQKGLC